MQNRSDRGTVGNRMSEQERDLLKHVMIWGSTGYPTTKVRSRWINAPMFGVELPGVYRTKIEAVARFEAFVQVLIDAAGQEAYERVTAA